MQVSAQNKATYPWPPGERRRGGNPGRQPRPGPTSVLRCPAAGHQRAAPPVAKYWQPVPVRGRRPGPAPLNQQTHNLQVNPFLCGHIGPRIALPKCLTTPADGQGWMGPRQAQRAAALPLSLTHSHTSVGGRGCRTSPAGLGFPPALGCRPKPPKWPSRPGKRVHTYLGGRTFRFKLGLFLLSTQGVPAAALSPAKNLGEEGGRSG